DLFFVRQLAKLVNRHVIQAIIDGLRVTRRTSGVFGLRHLFFKIVVTDLAELGGTETFFQRRVGDDVNSTRVRSRDTILIFLMVRAAKNSISSHRFTPQWLNVNIPPTTRRSIVLPSPNSKGFFVIPCCSDQCPKLGPLILS